MDDGVFENIGWFAILQPTIFPIFMSYCDSFSLLNFFEAIVGIPYKPDDLVIMCERALKSSVGVLQACLKKWLVGKPLPDKLNIKLDVDGWSGWTSVQSLLSMMHSMEHLEGNFYVILPHLARMVDDEEDDDNDDGDQGEEDQDGKIWQKVTLNKSKRFHTEFPEVKVLPFLNNDENKITCAAFGYHGIARKTAIFGTLMGDLIFGQQTEVSEFSYLNSLNISTKPIIKLVTHPSSKIGLLLDESFKVHVIFFSERMIHLVYLDIYCVPEMVTENCLFGRTRCLIRENADARFWIYNGHVNLFVEHFVKLIVDRNGEEKIQMVVPEHDIEPKRLRPPPWLDIPRSRLSVLCQANGIHYHATRHIIVGATRCTVKSQFYHYLGIFQNSKMIDREIFWSLKNTLIFGWCLSVDRRKMFIGALTKIKTVEEFQENFCHGWSVKSRSWFPSRRKNNHCFCVTSFHDYLSIVIIEIDLEEINFSAKHLRKELSSATRLRFFDEASEGAKTLCHVKIVSQPLDRENIWCTDTRLYTQVATLNLLCFPLCLGLGANIFSLGTSRNNNDYIFRKDETESIKISYGDNGFREALITIECPRHEGKDFRVSRQLEGWRARINFRKRTYMELTKKDSWKETNVSRRRLQN